MSGDERKPSGSGQSAELTWPGLWAIGRYDLRLTDDEFWSYTLREVFLLIDRWEADRKHRELLAGIVASTTANCNRDPNKGKPFTPEDFMPSGHRKKEQTIEEQAELLRAFTIINGGVVN